MIEWIEGKIYQKEPAKLIIEREGLAIAIAIPLSTYEKAGEIGEKIKIFTYLSIKNEKLELFGFKTIEERVFFTDLLIVDGIGPYTALRIMSRTTFEEFKVNIVKEDTDAISSIKGIGEKRANKMIMELKEKYKKEDIPESLENTAIKALVGLGIEPIKARKLVLIVGADPRVCLKTASLEEIIKEALKHL
ncbi:MAG: Holliday junction branch migration protein RuvA [Candidatus Stahlbacteria bacterium]|nr:Holliday junction branch migration protein RuvA [Candidatus Stahlbacteria bacterium]